MERQRGEARARYRGRYLSKEELVNKLFQLGRIGQLQGEDIEWAQEYGVDNSPRIWLNEEGDEIAEDLEDLLDRQF